MSLNLAWPQSEGLLGSLTFEVEEEQPSLQQVRQAAIAALKQAEARVSGASDQSDYDNLMVVPMESGISLQELQQEWQNQELNFKTTAAKLAESPEQTVDLDDYENLLDIHIVAVILKPKSPSPAPAPAEPDFRHADTRRRKRTEEDVSPAAGPSKRRASSAGCQQCQAHGIRVKHAHPSTCPSQPTCSICMQRGHFTGQCGASSVAPYTHPANEAVKGKTKTKKRQTIFAPPPALEDEAPFAPVASSSTAVDPPEQFAFQVPSRRGSSSEFSAPDTATSSLSPSMTVASTATGISNTSAMSISEGHDLPPIYTDANNNIIGRSKMPHSFRRKTKVQKVAEAKQRKAHLKQRLKHLDPHRLVELRPQMVFPKNLTDGRDGTIGLYDGVMVWAKMPDFPWWPGEVVCFEEGGIVPLEAKDITILFFEEDGQRTQGIVARYTLLQLGTSDEFDELMMSSQKAVTASKSKANRARQQALYKAYEWARAAEEDDSDDTDVSQ